MSLDNIKTKQHEAWMDAIDSGYANNIKTIKDMKNIEYA